MAIRRVSTLWVYFRIFFPPVRIWLCELWISPLQGVPDAIEPVCPSVSLLLSVTVLLQAIPAVLKGLKVQSAAWLQGGITVRDRLNVRINSEFLSVLGAQYQSQRLHSVIWSEDTSVLTLIPVSESQKQKFITLAFCSGVCHRPGGKNYKRAALTKGLR